MTRPTRQREPNPTGEPGNATYPQPPPDAGPWLLVAPTSLWHQDPCLLVAMLDEPKGNKGKQMTPTQRLNAAAELIRQYGSTYSNGVIHLNHGTFVVSQDHLQATLLNNLLAGAKQDGTATVYGKYTARLPDPLGMGAATVDAWVYLKWVGETWMIGSCSIRGHRGEAVRVHLDRTVTG